MFSESVVERSIEECHELTAGELIEALDGVPPHKLHCPALAVAALRDALSHWETREDVQPRKALKDTKGEGLIEFRNCC
jgi:nitrogen fixation NifU-like protein